MNVNVQSDTYTYKRSAGHSPSADTDNIIGLFTQTGTQGSLGKKKTKSFLLLDYIVCTNKHRRSLSVPMSYSDFWESGRESINTQLGANLWFERQSSSLPLQTSVRQVELELPGSPVSQTTNDGEQHESEAFRSHCTNRQLRGESTN